MNFITLISALSCCNCYPILKNSFIFLQKNALVSFCTDTSFEIVDGLNTCEESYVGTLDFLFFKLHFPVILVSRHCSETCNY